MKHSKPILFLIVIFATTLIPSVCLATVPTRMQFQGFLTDSVSGQPLNGQADLTFEIHDLASAGTPVWTEAHGLVDVVNGVYTVELGSINDASGGAALTEVLLNPNHGTLELQVIVDGAPLTPSQKITSVMFAFEAIDADTVDGMHASDFGDITGISTGPHLTGGGTGGDVEVGLNIPLRIGGAPAAALIEVSNDNGPAIEGSNASASTLGILGTNRAGVYGRSDGGLAGEFQGNVRVTGELSVEQGISGERDPTVNTLGKATLPCTNGQIVKRIDTAWQCVTDGSAGIDGHSLNSADGTRTDVVFVDNSGNVGIGQQTPSAKLDLIGAIKATPGTYAYEQGNVVLDFQTPRCSCDSTDTNIDCEFTFYTMSDEDTTCYDWHQTSVFPSGWVNNSTAYDRMPDPAAVMEMGSSNDMIIRSLQLQPARYLYTQHPITYSGHLAPRCPCDTAIEEGAWECGVLGGVLSSGRFYTNIDRGPSCYDWVLTGGVSESYHFNRASYVSLSADLANGITVNDYATFNGDVRMGSASSNGARLAVRNGTQDSDNYGIHATSIFGTGGYFSSTFGHGLVVEHGNVGIGDVNPTQPLQMASGAHVTPGGVWTNASSREYKENVVELTPEEASEVLHGLDPVKFNYKAEKGEGHLGFIAEDVPDLLATPDRKGVASMDIVALLTKVVQQQQKTIEELSRKVTKLEADRPWDRPGIPFVQP